MLRFSQSAETNVSSAAGCVQRGYQTFFGGVCGFVTMSGTFHITNSNLIISAVLPVYSLTEQLPVHLTGVYSAAKLLVLLEKSVKNQNECNLLSCCTRHK